MKYFDQSVKDAPMVNNNYDLCQLCLTLVDI
jgi:hypothetical protein